MSFIIKDNLVAINIKITTQGRTDIANGNFKIAKWAVGDSEVNYEFFNRTGIEPTEFHIQRPKDINPNFKSFIYRNLDDETPFTEISSITSLNTVITNTIPQRGFFTEDNGNFNINLLDIYIKQSDLVLEISDLDGGSNITIQRGTSFGPNTYVPVVGDILLIALISPTYSGNTSTIDDNGFVNKEIPLPYLFFRVDQIVNNDIGNDNYIVTLDRNIPDFDGNGVGKFSNIVVYPNPSEFQSYYGSEFVSDFVDNDIINFSQNCISPLIDVPVWNMNIFFNNDIIGVTNLFKSLPDYISSKYAGFYHYLDNIVSGDTIGIIHYTNNSPSNIYGESLHEDTPVMEIPTIMWHKKNNNELGLTLTCNNLQILPDQNLKFYDLVDESNNIVGKCFNDLRIFVIEDQELLFAMSYKSNRNWTLPAPKAGFNIIGCDID